MSSNSAKIDYTKFGWKINDEQNVKDVFVKRMINKSKFGQFKSNVNLSNFNDANNIQKKNSSNLARSYSQTKNLIVPELSINEETTSKRELELAHKMKNILFWSVSHELRNPINHINGILEWISSYVSKDDRIHQFVNIALSSTSMLMHKIDDIMDYSLLETNTLNLRLEEFNIRKMMASIQEMLILQFDTVVYNKCT